MDNKNIPDELLGEVAGGEGVNRWAETVSAAMIIAAKLQGMTLKEFLEKHPKLAADPDLADYIARVWNSN